MDPRVITTFLPQQVVKRLRCHRAEHGHVQPDRVDAAFLFFDIAGFTELADRTERSAAGVETLYRLISEVFSPIVDNCLDACGDVLYFAGDGLGVVFVASEELGLAHMTRQAVSVAKALVSTPRQAAVRAAVGAGSCELVEVGGVDGRWVLVGEGPAMAQAHAADKLGLAGQVTVSPEAWALLDDGFVGQRMDGGVRKVVTAPSMKVAPCGPQQLPQELVAPALRYLSPPLVRGLSSDTGQWIAELRLISTVFISIPDARIGNAALQRCMVVCQEQMNRVGGFVHEVLGDKGLGFLCVVGAPPLSHEDDAARAVDAAMAIRAELARLGMGSAIGIATDHVYCGVIGSQRRRQYEMYGRSMSLAARLMQATDDDGILVDARTRAAANHRVEFDSARALNLKGFPGTTLAYRPKGRHARRREHGSAMVGRSDILAHIQSRIAEAGRKGGAVLIQAEAGMGKSMLVAQVLNKAQQTGQRILFGAADSMEERTALFALRAVLSELCGLYPGIATSEAQRIVVDRLRAHTPEMMELAPLLNAVLPLDLPESSLTEQLTGSVRAENLVQLLLSLFRKEAENQPVVIVLEDLHWMDAGSWALCSKLLDEVSGLLLIGTLRPMVSEPPELEHLVRGEGRELQLLHVLDRANTGVILARCLGVEHVDANALHAIYERSEGIPFYSEEVAHALRESGALVIHSGRASLTADQGALRLPGNVTGVITSRIDRLPPQVQLTLKIASVIGRFFELTALIALHPVSEAEAQCPVHAAALVEAALVSQSPQQPGLYFFRHALTHETTYGLLTATQRRELHRSAAEQLEQSHESDLSAYYGRLAEHWQKANVPDKASHYSVLAGEQALAIWDNRNAITLFERAISLDEQTRSDRPAINLKHARLHQLMGDAWYSVPDNAVARKHYERAFELAGFPTPRFSWRTPIELFKHILGRWISPNSNPSPTLRERCLSALKAFDNLSVICLWSGDRLGLVHVVFASDNIGKLGGPSAEAALARNMVGYSLVLAGLTNIGERDIRAAHAVAWSQDQLYARMVLDVFLGLTLTALARPEEAFPYLHRGWDLSRKLKGGLWKHRADYMLGEAYLVTGQYEKAKPYFQSCAEIAKGAEPHTQGFATASWVLCDLRRGVDPAALAPILESPSVGVPRTRQEGPYGMQLAVAIGVQMEVYLRLGRHAEAFALASESMDLVESGDDTYSYFRGSEAHTLTALTIHNLWERQKTAYLEGVPDTATLRRHALRTLKHLKRGHKTFPAAESRHRLFRGIFARIDGDPTTARKEFLRCIAFSERVGFPWEVVVASVELARISQGEERNAHLTKAHEVATKYGLVVEVSDNPSIGIGAA